MANEIPNLWCRAEDGTYPKLEKKLIIKYLTRKETQEEWEERVKHHMLELGWEHDRDDSEAIGFFCIDKITGHKWIRDFNKHSRSFLQYEGDLKINLKIEHGK